MTRTNASGEQCGRHCLCEQELVAGPRLEHDLGGFLAFASCWSVFVRGDINGGREEELEVLWGEGACGIFRLGNQRQVLKLPRLLGKGINTPDVSRHNDNSLYLPYRVRTFRSQSFLFGSEFGSATIFPWYISL